MIYKISVNFNIFTQYFSEKTNNGLKVLYTNTQSLSDLIWIPDSFYLLSKITSCSLKHHHELVCSEDSSE